ncbi:MAG: 30S ribosomal protein S4 [Clostridia bacterium]|nr:30S ribosomal protein S4 [Clostridia bacterium]
MARYTGPSCRLCRREGQKLFLKGDRCYSSKCSFNSRSFAPGQHGKARKKISEYGLQLREKQKARRYYGVNETQFAKYFEMADKAAGMTGENLLRILESRLDNVVYKMGLAHSRKEARQLLLHGHFTVNGKKVTIPSYLVKAGTVVALAESSRDSAKFKAIIEAGFTRPAAKWLDFNAEKCAATVLNLPSREEVDFPFEEHLIVELYSK